jgi:hypothetical protein
VTIPSISSSSPNTMKCANCNQSVPTNTVDLHLIHCVKKYRFCDSCQIPVPIADDHKHCEICQRPYRSYDAHFKQWHTFLRCVCGKDIERHLLESHKTNDCPHKLVTCRFCSLLVPVGDISSMDARDRIMGFTSEHEAVCGNRTDRCQVCGRLERLKDMDLHHKAFHA